MLERQERMRSNADITSAVERHADTVMRVCTLYFRSSADRDDAFQETFIKYARSENEFNDEEHRKAWLIRVATNTCKDLLKRAERQTVLLGEIDEAAHPNWSAYSDGDEMNRADRVSELANALQKLDGKYRIVLYLKYYEGYSAAEIATMLDMPENTVYTNLARGRNQLKEVLVNG